jgi:hypothetical protein
MNRDSLLDDAHLHQYDQRRIAGGWAQKIPRFNEQPRRLRRGIGPIEIE